MRVLIVLTLLALARADVGGYNYGGGAGFADNSGTSGGASYPDSGAANLGGPIGGDDGGAAVGGGGLDVGHAPAAPADADFQKEFFTFTAPEADFDDGKSLNDLTSSVKKNLRVIFIKGPENSGLSEAALNLAKHANEARTAIYVLQKQNDISGLAQKLQNINNQNANKPEVHFVKYRTPEEAAHAQQAIQQQYNGLGGHTQSHDGGVAPVLNFASKAPAQPAPIGGGSHGGGSAAPSNGYIPPASSPQAPSGTYLPVLKV